MGNAGCRRARESLNFGQLVEVSAQHLALQDEIGEFAFAHNLNQARGFQLFEVMRERGGADAVRLVYAAAGHHRVLAGAEFLQNLVPARFGQRTRDARELLFRQTSRLSHAHAAKNRQQENRSPGRGAWRLGT